MKKPLNIPKATELIFNRATEFSPDQVCNACGRSLKSVLAKPRFTSINIDEELGLTIYSCGEKCSNTIKNGKHTDAFIKKQIDMIVHVSAKAEVQAKNA